MNSSYQSSFYAFFFSLWQNCKKVGTATFNELCKIATKKSKSSARKKPSYFLFLSSCALAVAAWLSMQTEKSDPIFLKVQEAGWKSSTSANCGGNGLYEISSANDSAEVYIQNGETFSAKNALPEAPYICRKIENPSLISEIE